jgi:hypothetical protein
MKKFTGLFLIALISFCMPTHAQMVNKIEYFFDSDPGFGNGTSVTVTAAADIPNLPINANIASLTTGLHRIYLRSRRDDGVWSITNSWFFLKTGAFSSVNVTRLEYFFDSDPGFGNGTSVPITPAPDVSDLSIPINIGPLSNGVHRLFVRVAGNDGSWSILNSWLFYKSGQFSPVTVNRLEYFFDADPGFGNGVSVAISPAVTINNFSFDAGIASLGLGLHTLFVRTQSNDGSWSQTTQWLFYKASLAGAGNLTALEYFIDTDPGFGSGTPLTIASSADLTNLSFDLNIASLPGGTHRLYVRSRDQAGNWSISNVAEFERLAALPVDWLSFTAEQKDAQVLLEWKTENEVNNDHYEAEYSTDGTIYRIIATIPAQSSAGVNTYTYLHQHPNRNGINYYRIKQVDIDGHSTHSVTRTVDMREAVFARVSPNPVSDVATVKVNDRNLILRLFDLHGRQLLSLFSSDGNSSIDLSGLTAGSYLLVIEKQGKLLETLKIVKK